MTKIDISDDSHSQFILDNLIAAAELLADAEVDVIGWSGTSAGWLGFQHDQALCQAIQNATGIPATTSVLAFNECLQLSKAKQVGLVTPYVERVSDQIRSNYSSLGFEIPPERERHLDITRNSAFAEVGEAQLDSMVADVVGSGSKVIMIYCTNLLAAQRTAYWEKQHDCTVLDSVASVIWGMLRCKGLDPSCVRGWGSLFQIS